MGGVIGVGDDIGIDINRCGRNGGDGNYDNRKRSLEMDNGTDTSSITSIGDGSGRRGLGEIPYVSPDGGKTRYYADRCYLDAPTGERNLMMLYFFDLMLGVDFISPKK